MKIIIIQSHQPPIHSYNKTRVIFEKQPTSFLSNFDYCIINHYLPTRYIFANILTQKFFKVFQNKFYIIAN